MDSWPLLLGRPEIRAGDEGLRDLEMQLNIEYWTRFSPLRNVSI